MSAFAQQNPVVHVVAHIDQDQVVVLILNAELQRRKVLNDIIGLLLFVRLLVFSNQTLLHYLLAFVLAVGSPIELNGFLVSTCEP